MKESIKLIAGFTIFLIMILGRLFVWDFFIVDGASMCPSLNQFQSHCFSGKSQVLLVNKFNKDFDRYDIVVFNHPEESTKLIKRIIGLPKETILIQNNNAFLKTQNSIESLRYNRVGSVFDFSEEFTEFLVPENQIFLLGDNRTISIDSRNCFNYNSKDCYRSQSNYLQPENIIGKASISIFPAKKL